MQNIISANNIWANKLIFNILFNIKNIANFYVMSFNSLLACYYFEEYKDLIIEDNIS